MRLTGIAPQFLVHDLDRATAYYCDKLGFDLEFTYEGFYASVMRDGFAIHLKHGPPQAAEREHRKREEHLDAYISVVGINAIFKELERNEARVIKPLEQRPWACLDFYVEDADGYVLCFSERQMDAGAQLSSIGHPVAELPVTDVERAQEHYRDALGFKIGWTTPDKEIGSVFREGEATVFFRKRELPFEPAVHWIFAHDIDTSYRELQSSGAKIVEPLETKPWGLRQFTIEDLDGNRFYLHHA